MPAASEPGSSVARVPTRRDGHTLDPRLLDELFAKAGAARWQITPAQFGRVLERSSAHRFADARPSPGEVESYLRSLHLEDLALACACAEGKESAWEHFVREFRPVLYAAARAIAGEGNARELADSIYAELYGLETREESGERRSLFRYFHGRSKLSTWLRAVLAQRYVDAIRAARRTEPLEDEADEAGGQAARATSVLPPDPERSRYVALLQEALTSAIGGLHPRDRLRLCYYYVQDLTLAQIGRLLGEHEATVSRKLDRTRGELRRQVEAMLRDPNGSGRLSDAQVQLCFEYAQQDWPFDLTRVLSRGSDVKS